MIIPFNPLDKKHLGESVGQAMLRGSVFPLGELEKFKGAGVYAIYYTGDFPAYEAIAAANSNNRFNAPIYVGKAVPSGARKGSSLDDATPGPELFNRLNDHRKSIEAAANLQISDFFCRYLVVEDIWIPLGESLLISKCNPIWNLLIDGFGNHDPGSGRHKGVKPRWDVLHPGRSWADKLMPRDETPSQIEQEAKAYLRDNPPKGEMILVNS